MVGGAKSGDPSLADNSRARIGLHGSTEPVRVRHRSGQPTGAASTKTAEGGDIMVEAQRMQTPVAKRFRSDDERWAAVVSRDHAAVG